MIQVSCDLCGKDLRPGEKQHYVVKIDVYPAHDPSQLTEADLEDDHLQAVSEILSDEESDLTELELEEPVHARHRFDLCAECRKKFVRDPLSREANMHFDFSEN